MIKKFEVGKVYICHVEPTNKKIGPAWVKLMSNQINSPLTCTGLSSNKVFGRLKPNDTSQLSYFWNPLWVNEYVSNKKVTVKPPVGSVGPAWHAGMPIGTSGPPGPAGFFGGSPIVIPKDDKIHFSLFGKADTTTPTKCYCSLWAGCTCGMFEAEMKKAGKVYDPFMRIWTNPK